MDLASSCRVSPSDLGRSAICSPKKTDHADTRLVRTGSSVSDAAPLFASC